MKIFFPDINRYVYLANSSCHKKLWPLIRPNVCQIIPLTSPHSLFSNRMSTRQNKVSKQVQKDIASIIQQYSSDMIPGKMLTVTSVRISPDLGVAKIYISVFPSSDSDKNIALLNQHKNIFRNDLGKKLRHQLRKVPEIIFYLDDSLDYLDNINKLLK